MRPGDFTQKERRQMREDNLRFPLHLVEIPREAWPMRQAPAGMFKVWRSRHFLVQVYRVSDDMLRLSVSVNEVVGDRWKDGIAWDQLQDIKRQCGYGKKDAVEVYPADSDLVNVANMRHLWVYLNEELPFAWRRENV